MGVVTNDKLNVLPNAITWIVKMMHTRAHGRFAGTHQDTKIIGCFSHERGAKECAERAIDRVRRSREFYKHGDGGEAKWGDGHVELGDLKVDKKSMKWYISWEKHKVAVSDN